MADAAQNPGEAAQIRALTSVRNKAAYDDWTGLCKGMIDALEDWPSVKFSLARLAEVAHHMESRVYSIASSPLAVKNSVELCVGVVKYDTVEGALREGLASTMLAKAEKVVCKVRSAPHMRLPQDTSTPIACVCGGTGIAPFLGFIEERAEQKAQGATVGPITLYFGCRGDYDCLHSDRLLKWQAEGLIRSSVSYSRKPDRPKEYVYDALRRDSAQLKKLLCGSIARGCEGGYFYLCGSASGLAKDCTSVLAEIIGDGDVARGMSEIGNLQDIGRVVFDVWG